jgi:hypothetical protein
MDFLSLAFFVDVKTRSLQFSSSAPTSKDQLVIARSDSFNWSCVNEAELWRIMDMDRTSPKVALLWHRFRLFVDGMLCEGIDR